VRPALPLEAFVELLRKHGFEATIDDRLALNLLLSDDQDWDIERLRRILKATFARSVEERAQLDHLFDSFFVEPALPRSALASPTSKRRPRNTVVVGGALALAATFATVATLENRSENPSTSAPVAGPRKDSSAGGTFAARKPSLDAEPAELAAERSRRRYPALAGLSSVFLAALVGLYFFRRRALYLRLSGPFLFEPTYAEHAPLIMPRDPKLVEDTAVLLGRRRPGHAAREIDVFRTLRRTLRTGLPSVVWTSPPEPPRFLVLLDWSPRFRQIASILAMFVQELVEAGTRCEVYRFERRRRIASPLAGKTGACFSQHLLRFDTMPYSSSATPMSHAGRYRKSPRLGSLISAKRTAESGFSRVRRWRVRWVLSGLNPPGSARDWLR